MAYIMKSCLRTAVCAGTIALMLSACASSPQHQFSREVGLQQRAAHAYEQGNLQQALIDYRELANELPDDGSTWFRLGNVYARLNQPQAAVEAYRHLLQRDSGNAKAWHNLAVVYMHQAAAAFVQSAHTAGGDDALRQLSMGMATHLDHIASGRDANASSVVKHGNKKTAAADDVSAASKASSPVEGANR